MRKSVLFCIVALLIAGCYSLQPSNKVPDASETANGHLYHWYRDYSKVRRVHAGECPHPSHRPDTIVIVEHRALSK